VCRIISCIVLVAGLWLPANSQEAHRYSISVFGTLSTSSKLFRNPDSPNDLLREQYVPFDNFLSEGIDVRRDFPDIHLQVGLSIEYLTKSQTYYLTSPATFQAIPVEDGFSVVPIELSGYFPIPISTSSFHVYIGGGTGMYLGSRHYEYAGAQAGTVSHKTEFGIQVLSGIEYAIASPFLIRCEAKFRDVQFETTNQFQQPAVHYLRSTEPLDEIPFTSRISIDGLALNIGIVYEF